MARFLLGVSGGVAAYRALELARLATRAGHGVRVLMTPAAKRFVGPASFEAITGAPVLSDEFERDPMRGGFPGEPAPEHDPIGHLEVAANADAYLIAPASANTIAKLAAGIADSMLTTAFLACAAPRAVAPAMNNRMYEDAATQANLATLRERGILVVDPEEGALASRGEHGVGRLAQPERLLAALESMAPAPAGPWDGLHVLITAGGTREPIDSVRYIGNRSSGRMGLALAAAARARGADVTVVAANVLLPAAPGVRVVAVETAAELAAACDERFDAADVLLMAAAVADFRPAAPETSKISKADQAGGLNLSLEATADVLAALSERRRPGQVLVGFAAEHGEGGVDRARGKLEHKQLDAVVVNDISRADIGFDTPDNEVTILTVAGPDQHVPVGSKAQVASAIIDAVEALRAGGVGGAAEAS
ncbi:MAG: phosphopantothenoylcysteine decarboxylase / phosphopantothenate---cysteine ligase, partial [Solirubrobacteraceae bacterium]|nr:phosphopantothenoylcysteine decarboxylase / phosphopantothenate---cysteine ligase [Solirubrobacteraceae bacterium]